MPPPFENVGASAAEAFGGLLHQELQALELRLMAQYSAGARAAGAQAAGLGLRTPVKVHVGGGDTPQAPPLSDPCEDLLLSCTPTPHSNGTLGMIPAQGNLRPLEASSINLTPRGDSKPLETEPSWGSTKANFTIDPPQADEPKERGNRNSLATDDGSEQKKEEERKQKNKQPNLFADLNQMREDMKNKPRYDVKDFYWETGFWQRLATNPKFENVTLGIISINALWMAVDTDNNTADTLLTAEPIFQFAEHAFCVYFSFEWFSRFMAFKRKLNGLKDAWFVFDSVLVFMMVMETWVLTLVMVFMMDGEGGSSPLGNASILRLLRLARLSRMARMLRSMPELLILIKGMVAAIRSVGFVLLLLFIIMYVFSIAFVQLMRGTASGDAYFPGIPASMVTLMVAGTFMDNIGEVVHEVGADNMVCAVLFFAFVGLSALTVMNMLIGVLCEIVSSVAEFEKESMLIAGLRENIEDLWKTIDEDGTGQLSKEEFGAIITNKDAFRALDQIKVDPVSLANLTDQIFEPDAESNEEKNLSIDEFMDVILSFRETNTATVKDMNDLRKWISGNLHRQQHQLDLVLKELHKANGTPKSTPKSTPRSPSKQVNL